ncbi:phenylalanine--tRNA ligase subunit beta [Rickettsiella endosymbiont of Dermanyssus gallinae]|uniref:phenylalanine--tRNA ligase subunit beta n=1 Tax=Rickettsiella endosymbiont of Dermanyssus gallinae TaxID=2856608 RepID=UPI001C532ABC|nr:phenylalanine--tRNA ligase subunit beta [Rickettsiella endosymbiont of Dermanyssus gallinae]
MKLSEQWLREWVNPALDVHALAEQLTLAGLEVESVDPVAGQFTQVVVGHIKAVEPHPDPKVSRLQVCQVDVGDSLLSIVCGAPNARAGLKVAVACVGATLPNDIRIKEAKLRGALSQGMLCSNAELGLAKESEGILELPLDAPIGKDLRDYLQLDDYAIDVHLTPNRSDCLSVKGLARDLAALTDSSLITHAIPKHAQDISDQLPITIKSTDDCPRYCVRIIRGINPDAQTPIWMIERLRRSGFRAIHPVVDVTNYVLLELGQPLHAFDLSRLDSEIIVRRAKKDEKLVLLDGKEVSLDKDTLVVADKTQAQAIAGVMGGLDSSVSKQTSDILLESAFFNPTVLAGRARHYGLSSESAYRFERGVDPDLAPQAIERATQLLIEIVGGKIGPVVESQWALAKQTAITLRQARVKKLLGIVLTEADIEAILQRLGMVFSKHSREENSWQVTPPRWRFDIDKEADLIEELARVHGYHNIPETSPCAALHFMGNSESKLPLNRVRRLLVDRDYHEAITYSFTSPQLQHSIDPQQTPFTLVNPISSELSVMRSSLWPGLLNAARYNQKRQQSRVRLFETGLCFQTVKEALSQNPMLAGIAVGDSAAEQWGLAKKNLDFFSVKSDIEALLRLTEQLSNTQFIPTSHPALHPGQSAELIQGEEVLGYFGALHPKLLMELDLIGPVYLFELSLSKMIQSKLPCFEAFSKFPLVRRDISFWVEETFSAQAILEQVKKDAGDWLNDSYLFDVYHDKEKEKAKRSLALALLWQHPSRTLVDTEVDDLLKKVIQGLEQHFTIQLRE